MLREDILIRMQQAGQALNLENPIYLKADGLSRLPRKLDKAPKPITLRAPSLEQSYGCANEFIMMYNEQRTSQGLETAKIRVNNAVRFCDPEVYYALYCLALNSVHCVPERAVAAGDLFKTIMTTPCNVLTVAKVYERLQTMHPKEYYMKQLMMALKACLFGSNSAVLYWMTLASDHAYYKEASKLGAQLIRERELDEKSLKEFLNEQWVSAKADTEFMKKLYKPMCNKWMSAMIYALKDNPVVFETSGSFDGFL